MPHPINQREGLRLPAPGSKKGVPTTDKDRAFIAEPIDGPLLECTCVQCTGVFVEDDTDLADERAAG
jgi:hypothetical protein